MKGGVLVIREFDEFSRILAESGFEIINLPLIETEALRDLSGFDAQLETIEDYDGIFLTSRCAARIFAERLREKKINFSGKVYILGRRSFDLLKREKLDLVFDAGVNTAREFLEKIPLKDLKNKRFLFIRGEKSLRVVPEFLGKIAEIDESMPAYVRTPSTENTLGQTRLWAGPDDISRPGGQAVASTNDTDASDANAVDDAPVRQPTANVPVSSSVRDLLVVSSSAMGGSFEGEGGHRGLLIFNRTDTGDVAPKAVISGPKTGIIQGAWQLYDESAPDWPWTDGLRHLVECIQQGVRPQITPEHGFHVLEIMLKAKQAGRDGRAQEITSTFTPPSFAEPGEEAAAHLIHDRTSGRSS